MNEIVIKNINRILKAKGLTIYRLDGLSAQQMWKVLKHGNPTVKTLEKLSTALQVDIVEFFRK